MTTQNTFKFHQLLSISVVLIAFSALSVYLTYQHFAVTPLPATYLLVGKLALLVLLFSLLLWLIFKRPVSTLRQMLSNESNIPFTENFWDDGLPHLQKEISRLLAKGKTDKQAFDAKSSESEKMSSLSKSQVARMESIVNTVVDGVITIDSLGIIETFNPAAERLFGYSPEEVIGQNVSILMPSPYKEEHDSYLRNYLQTGKAQIIGIGREVLGEKKSGQLFPLELSVSAMEVEGQRMFTGIVRDISPLIEQKALLQDQVTRVKTIIETVVDGIITIDSKGNVDSFNPSAERIFGYDANEVLGKNIKMLMPSPYQEEHDNYLFNYLQTGKAKVIGKGREVVGKKKNGQLFPMTLAVSEMEIKGRRMFTGIVRDISDIAEQKSLLQDQVSRIKSVIETVVDGVITINSKGIIDTFNPAAEKIFGYRGEEVIGLNIKMLMPSPYAQEHDGYLTNFMDSGIPKVIGTGREVLGKRKNGSVFPMSLSVSEMEVGEQKMFTGIVRDISEQKKYETALNQYRESLEEQVQERTIELQKATEQAESANKAKSKFLSRMSHELRTPLNAIIGFTQILQDEQLSADQQDSLSETHNAGSDLLRMVNEVLQVVAIEAGDIRVSLEEVSLKDCLSDAIHLLSLEANRKGISITNDILGNYYVRADYARLKQVLSNLISNAIKFNHDKGSIHFSANKSGDQLEVSIADSGKGMTEEEQKSLFLAFERASSEYEGEQGAGIGLTIVAEFMKAMKGQVHVRSELGKGSTFTLVLPLLRISEQKATQETSILYIEDNPTNRKLMQRLIGRFGDIHYLEAETGQEGIENARQHSPSLILLDINLPDLSGYDVFNELQKYPETVDIPIIAVSANAMAGDIEKAKTQGFSAYLTKPVEITELNETLQRYLPNPPTG